MKSKLGTLIIAHPYRHPSWHTSLPESSIFYPIWAWNIQFGKKSSCCNFPTTAGASLHVLAWNVILAE